MVQEIILPSEKSSEWEVHDCDIGGVILLGGPAKIEIESNGKYTLQRGDAFYVKAGLKHRMINLGRRQLKQLTIMAPPRY